MGCAHGGEPNAKENAPLWAPSYHTSDGRLQNKNHPWKLETKARVVSNQVLLERSTIEKCYGGRARERATPWGAIWTRKMRPKSVWPNELENDGVYVKTGSGRENRRWT